MPDARMHSRLLEMWPAVAVPGTAAGGRVAPTEPRAGVPANAAGAQAAADDRAQAGVSIALRNS